MNHIASLREHLIALLSGRQAHLDYTDILNGVPFELQGKRPSQAPYSPWMLLEHLRIAQWDILEFSRDPGHVSPEFPSGYWPLSESPLHPLAWAESLKAFDSDLKAMQQLIADPKTDLFTPIPHGTGQTILREALLIADHNSYHLGQLLLLRKQLGCPPEKTLG